MLRSAMRPGRHILPSCSTGPNVGPDQLTHKSAYAIRCLHMQYELWVNEKTAGHRGTDHGQLPDGANPISVAGPDRDLRRGSAAIRRSSDPGDVAAAIAVYGPVRRTDLGRWLHFDSSTLTRNLRVMLDNSWLEEVADGKDGRGLPLRATEAGADLLHSLGAAWRKAQERAVQIVGDEGRSAVIGLFDKVQVAMAA